MEMTMAEVLCFAAGLSFGVAYGYVYFVGFKEGQKLSQTSSMVIPPPAPVMQDDIPTRVDIAKP
jgi:hypothetical protein